MLDQTSMGHVAMEKGGVVGTLAGSLTAWIGAMSLNDLLSIGGFMLALVSVTFQMWATWYFKTKSLRIAEARLASDLADKENDDG